MKILYIAWLLLFSLKVLAHSCEEIITPENEILSITRDEDPNVPIYHVRLPKEVSGEALGSLILEVQQEINGKIEELVVPLEVKTKGELTGSYFYLSSNWVSIKITGSYGKHLCTELSSNLKK